MNLLLWTGEFSDIHLPLVEQLKRMGFDGVELPLFGADEPKYARLGKQLDAIGIARTAVTIRGADDNPISPDAAVRRRGVDATRATLDSCAAAGVELLCGPFHSALGYFSGAGPTESEWKWGVGSMRAVAEHAATVGVQLGIEPLNRFECYFLNCHADGARFVRDVGHPNCRLMYDTFHAHIEEKNVGASIRACADVLGHVHISENDRSTPGKGAVRWEETFNALAETGYHGWMTVEAFGMALPEIAAATKIWRRMFDQEDQLARDALAFIQAECGKRAMR